MTVDTVIDNAPIAIPEEVRAMALENARFFETVSGDSPATWAADMLDTSRSLRHAEILERFAPLKGRKMLEVGSGFGIGLAVWIRQLGLDAYGIEPNSEGFGNSFQASRLLMAANGIDPERVVNAFGERMPFPDNSFDVVCSTNALEHVQDPYQVIAESIRVLKPGGILHFEVPNYLSYYEGHYLIWQPPVFSTSMLAWWVRLRGRNPAFARTINTISPIWCRRTVKRLRERYQVSVITFGQDIFLERLARPWKFETEQSRGMVRSVIRLVQAVNVGNWIGRLIVAAHGYYPLYLTLRKEPE